MHRMSTWTIVEWDRITEWNHTWALALVFGIVSVPWTYGFVAGHRLPLWPSFIASASFFATDGNLDGLVKSYSSNLAGICYAALTLGIVTGAGSTDVLLLSLVVGSFMFLASLHEFFPLFSFTPGGFIGYATLFGVNAANATAFGVSGIPGHILAAAVAMVIGALIGFLADQVSTMLAG